VAVAGLAGCPRLPPVVVLPAALAVGSGRVVAAVAAVAPVPAAPVQLPVIEALVRAATAVASWRGGKAGEVVGTWGAQGLKQPPVGLGEPEGLLGGAARAFSSASAFGSGGGGCTHGVMK